MVRKTKIAEWWDMVARYHIAEKLGVRAKPFNELTVEEMKRVYRYWTIGK